MRISAMWGLVLAALLGSGAAQAAQVQGWLELTWGDPQLAAGKVVTAGPPRFTATLVADDGTRYPLDTEEALAAAEDLHALANRRISVAFAPDGKGLSPYRVEAIVAADTGAANAKVLGTTVWVTLMCKFADVATEQKPQSFFQSQYGNAQG